MNMNKFHTQFLTIRKALSFAFKTFKVRAFGTYVNETDDGSIWEYKGKQYLFPEPKTVIITVRLSDLPQGMRDAIAELRLA